MNEKTGPCFYTSRDLARARNRVKQYEEAMTTCCDCEDCSRSLRNYESKYGKRYARAKALLLADALVNS